MYSDCVMEVEGDVQPYERVRRIPDILGVISPIRCQVKEGACLCGIDACCLDGGVEDILQ